MIHYCAHCDYTSDRRWCVLRHQSRKHKMVKEEVVEHPLPLLQLPPLPQRPPLLQLPLLQLPPLPQRPPLPRLLQQPLPPLPPLPQRELMEDSIEVFKIYKLLQRMKNK